MGWEGDGMGGGVVAWVRFCVWGAWKSNKSQLCVYCCVDGMGRDEMGGGVVAWVRFCVWGAWKSYKSTLPNALQFASNSSNLLPVPSN